MAIVVIYAVIALACVGVVIIAIWQAPLIPDDKPMAYEIDSDVIDKLNRIRLRAFEIDEEKEHLAAQACKLLNVDPQADSCARDWANEIVYHKTHVIPTINRIEAWRSLA